MKRKLMMILGGALAFVLASCSNLSDVSSNSSSSVNRSGSDQTLTLSLQNSSFEIARTIYPGDWSDWDQDYTDDDLAAGVYYVLTGFTVDNTTSTTASTDSSTFKNASDKTLSYQEFDYADLMKAEAQVSIKPLIWYFTLTAYQSAITATDGEVANGDACLVGTAWADMTTGAKTITFNMKPVSSGTTATGIAQMGLTFTPPDTFSYMTYGFYEESDTTAGTPDFSSAARDASTSTTTVVTLTKVAKASPETAGDDDYVLSTDSTEADAVITSAASTNGVSGCSYTYTLKDTGGKPTIIQNTLTAGVYWFKAEFYDNQNKRMAVYIEKYVIDGTNTSTADIELLEKAFNSAPENIEDLTLTYTFNENSFTSEPSVASHQLSEDDSDVISTYTATLKWTDVADNEAGYEIWLKYFGDSDEIGTDDPTDVVLSPDTATATLETYGLTAAQLQAGLTECALTLNTGVRYQISVRAYNDWSYAQSSYDDTYDATAESQGYDRFVPYEPRSDTTDGADNLTFGLYTIDYNLNGGVVKQTSAKSTASTITHYIVPYIYMEDNVLVGENDTAETFPYIKRSGYTFVGWNELYGATGWAIYSSGTTYNTKKYYYTNPGLTKKVSDETNSSVFTISGIVVADTTATVVLDSIVMDGTEKVSAPTSTGVGGTGSAGSPNYLATYSWTIPVWSSDGETFYVDNNGAQGTETVDVPVYAVVSPTRAEIAAAGTVTKCTYSNVMLAEGELINTDYLNREVYASWETPLTFSITLPKYPDVKLTKQAAEGDVLAYSVGEEITVNVTNSALSDIVFTVYADDGSTALTSLLADDSEAITTTGITVEDGDFTWDTSGYTAMTYYVKVTATYTYATDSTNSMSGETDTIEGWLFIRLEN